MAGPRVPGTIRVATVNLFAHHGDWDRRRAALRAGLRALDADVLALQEAIVDDMRFFTGWVSLEGISTAYRDAWEAVRGDEPGHTLDPRTR